MDDYNKDELCAPNWMNESFFENVLRNCENNESILGDDSVTSYKEGFLNMKNFEKMPYVMDGMDNFIDVVATIDELKMCIPPLKLIKMDLVQRCIQSFNSYIQEGKKGIFVLCHGDFHVKNMMFKHNEKDEVEDVMLIDFQVCYFGPAVLDVLYAVHILLSPNDFMNHAEELIHFYCLNFIETLQKLKFKGEIPKVADFMIELINHRHFDLLLLSTFSAMVYSQHVRKADVGTADLLSSNDIRKQLYRDPDFLKEIKHILPKMLYRGSLE